MQSKVRDFMRECPQPMSAETCINDIFSEAGEVAKEQNISTSWSRYPSEYRGNMTVEIGQLLFTVYQFAEVIGVDADNALEEVIKDFKERYARQGHTGSSTYLSGDL